MTRGKPHVRKDDEWVPLMDSDNWNPPQPQSNEKIWRYRSLGQYVTLLDREKLWFTRADQFDDPYEGSVPEPNIHDRHSKYADKGIQSSIENVYRSLRYLTYLNCWHMNDHESDAMWQLYADGQGVAIISTPAKLKNALNAEKLEFGEVSYIDYSTERIPEESTIAPFYYKRAGFKHEREYRVLHRDPEKFPDSGVPIVELGEYQDTGTPFSVEIDTLIEKVLVAPTAPDWLQSTVKSVTDQYGYDFGVEPSRMGGEPKF